MLFHTHMYFYHTTSLQNMMGSVTVCIDSWRGQDSKLMHFLSKIRFISTNNFVFVSYGFALERLLPQHGNQPSPLHFLPPTKGNANKKYFNNFIIIFSVQFHRSIEETKNILLILLIIISLPFCCFFYSCHAMVVPAKCMQDKRMKEKTTIANIF